MIDQFGQRQLQTNSVAPPSPSNDVQSDAAKASVAFTEQQQAKQQARILAEAPSPWVAPADWRDAASEWGTRQWVRL